MAEPLKNLFNVEVITRMADHLARIEDVDRARFLSLALDGLDGLEMMQRSAQIAGALAEVLPEDFLAALRGLTGLLHPETGADLDSLALDERGLRGWALVPVGTYVSAHGLGYPEPSLEFLREMTMRFSAEFAVRPFFRDHTELTLAHAERWARDANHHVRRLASEGSRPRLPWGLRLGVFVKDPAPLLPILEQLRNDPSEYVRRSVANNLNDIAKDHPDLVTGIARDWLRDAPAERVKLVKHACRTLIKGGDPKTLAVFGYGSPDGLRATLTCDAELTLGEALTVSVELKNTQAGALPALIDLVLWFRKADGRLTPKVFKWTETVVPPGTPLNLSKSIPLRDVTTRRHYSGAQAVALQVNGVELARAGFDLKLPN